MIKNILFLSLSFFLTSSLASAAVSPSNVVLRTADQGGNEGDKVVLRLTGTEINGKPALAAFVDFGGWAAVLPGSEFGSPAMPPLKETVILRFSKYFIDKISGDKVVEFVGSTQDQRAFKINVVCWAGYTLGASIQSTWPSRKNTANLSTSLRLNQAAGNCDWGFWERF